MASLIDSFIAAIFSDNLNTKIQSGKVVIVLYSCSVASFLKIVYFFELLINYCLFLLYYIYYLYSLLKIH